MNRLFCLVLVSMLGLAGMPAAVVAQTPPGPPAFSQAELDQMLAPIALYPDPLLSQVLAAATYPLETVQAARFVNQNPNLKGNDLASAIQAQTWDPSVKALTQFPSVLDMMDDQLAWMQRLGDAFLGQQNAVMDTVQALRAKARATGSLASYQRSAQQSVDVQGGLIAIEPATPDIIYVPYYDPNIVYGTWWWPENPPVVWVPPPEYQPPYFGNLFLHAIAFGIGVGVVDSLFFPIFPDWGGHRFVNGPWPVRARPGEPRRPQGSAWTHDPAHRLGVAYRDTATREHFRPADHGNVNRDAFRGHVASPEQIPGFSGPARQPHVATQAPPQPAMRPPIEPVHPFMPTGTASLTQTHAERGQSSRAGSGGADGSRRR